jgi:ATP-dependent exoDNAse (exonuclease V) alpha subunit
MELLQVDAMSTTFNMHDVIYIVVAVASGLAFYWKMVLNDKEMYSKIKRLKEDVSKNESVMFKKFAAIHTRMEKGEADTRQELTTLNAEINEVKVGISTINGKLDILINNKNI